MSESFQDSPLAFEPISFTETSCFPRAYFNRRENALMAFSFDGFQSDVTDSLHTILISRNRQHPYHDFLSALEEFSCVTKALCCLFSGDFNEVAVIRVLPETS